MKFDYLLPNTRDFLFALANAYEKSNGDITVYHQLAVPVFAQYGFRTEEYINTLVRLHYVNDTRNAIPTESGLHYQRLRRIYLTDRYITPAIVSFLTTIATLAASKIFERITGLLSSLSLFQ